MRSPVTTSTSPSQPADRLTPARIRLARERRGMSRAALAAALEMTAAALLRFETAGAPVGLAKQLSHVVDFPASFFTLPSIAALDAEQARFRAARRATDRQRSAARAIGALGVELYGWITDRFSLPEVNLPDLDGEDPRRAADAVRTLWGRASDVLPNLVQLAEANGVRVLSLPLDTQTVDAFSLWLDDRPYVFLADAKSAERTRFDLAHELGHLVLHSRGHAGPDAETEADRFAAALLMPLETLLPRAGRDPGTPTILRLKRTYGVSAMALARTLHDAGRLSDAAYRQHCIQLAQRGYRHGEPDGLPRQQSRVFAVTLGTPSGRSGTAAAAAADLGLTPIELHGLTFGQAWAPATSSRTTRATGWSEIDDWPRPTLRVV